MPRKPNRKTHADWEHERKLQGLCTKCNNPLSSTNAQFCQDHQIWARKRSQRAYQRNPSVANYRSKISGHRRRILAMQKIGGLVCVSCGERDYRLLTIDHINGHDEPVAKRSRLRGGLLSSDLEAINCGEATNLRILCWNCQARNEYVRGNRRIDPIIRQAILDAGGAIGDGLLGINKKPIT